MNPWIWLALVILGVGSILWVSTLSKVELSFAYPLVAMGIALITVSSAIIFSEHIPALRIVGVIVIMGGVIFLSRS